MSTELSNPEALATLKGMIERGEVPHYRQEFAESLIRQSTKGLSEKQWYWVRRLAVPEPDRERVELADHDSFDALSELFRKATTPHGKSKGLKYPKITLVTEDGRAVVLSVAGAKAKYPGSVNVTDGGSYHDNVWYGRIHVDGRFEMSRRADDPIVDLLKRFAADPATVASQYGKTTGCCCFCRKPLNDDRSLAVGYGPVCADQYGLDWGSRVRDTAAA